MAKDDSRKTEKAGEEKTENAPRRDGSERKTTDGASQFMKDKRKRTRIAGKSFEPVPRESRRREEEGSAHSSERPRRDDDRNDRPHRSDDRGERAPRRDDKDRRSGRSDDRNSGERRSFNPNFSNDNKPLFKERDRSDRPSRDFNDEDKWNRKDFNPSKERRSDSRGNNERGDRRPSRSFGERDNRFSKSSDERRGTYRDSREQGSDRKPFGKKPFEKKAFGDKPYDKKRQDKKPYGDRPQRDYGDNYPRFPAPKVEKEMRLNRYIAMSGVSSRREADELIKSGQVTVNGTVVTELGTKIKPGDEVRFNDKVIQGEKKVYIVMNKPKGYVTTLDDPHADKTVMDLMKSSVTERVYPVGRLDKNSLGVLLITNDGDLTTRLTHPSYNKKKIYQATLDKPLTRSDMEQIASGITLEDGEIHADEISYVKDNKREIGIVVHSGRNRIVRRIFEYLGYKVTKLDRVYFAGLTKKNLKRGAWRFLTPREVDTLMSGKYE